MVFVDLEQNTTEWLEYRRSHFNASEAGAIMGVGFKKPYEIAKLKKTPLDELKDFKSRAMELGHKYEPIIRDYINEQLKAKFEPCVVKEREISKFSSSLDGWDKKRGEFLEIKFSNDEFEYLKEHNEPTKKYFWQLMHSFFVTGAKKCIYAVGHLDENFELEIRFVEIKPKKADIDELLKAWDNFEKNYLNAEFDDEFIQTADELSELMHEKKELEAKIDELKAKAIAKANGTECKVGNVTIYKMTKKGTYDYKRFLDENHLQITDDYLGESKEIWSVRVAY